MVNLFANFTNISSAIAILAMLLLYIGIIANSQNMTQEDTYKFCSSQIRSCQISSVVFVLLGWFAATGDTARACLAGYELLSKSCSLLSSVWLLFAFANVTISMLLSIGKRSAAQLAMMKHFRNSSFLMGGVFLLFSFLMQTN